MITKYRNRAFLQMTAAIILSAALVFVIYKARHMRGDAGNLVGLGLLLYLAAYVMWAMSSLTLARARGYQRDAIGALFGVCCILGLFCFPILPMLFPFYIIFGLEDKTKDRMRRR